MMFGLLSVFFMDYSNTLRKQGFVVARGLLDPGICNDLKALAQEHLKQHIAPLELEADLHYVGAPVSRESVGGHTARRLLLAYERESAFREWATSCVVRETLMNYFGESIVLSRAHHNCIMTKHPHYGSLTNWHRDARYWSFERDDLVSVWLALGAENVENGGLWFVPQSHQLDLPAECFDEAKFFRTDLPGNAALIRTAVSPELRLGDVVFFHCNTLHFAQQNLSEAVKFSLVFTYHGASNSPIAGTRSASIPEIPLQVVSKKVTSSERL